MERDGRRTGLKDGEGRKKGGRAADGISLAKCCKEGRNGKIGSC